ncbi:hypothetical protein ACHAXR_012278 [Thalassiosira sp. AJA248-18]
MASATGSSGVASGSRDVAKNGDEKSNTATTISAVNSNSGNNTIAAAGPAAGGINKHSSSLSPLGYANGVAFLLGNHANYHFDLIETLTSIPLGRVQQARIRRRDRGLSISSQEGATVSNTENNIGSSPGGTPRVEGITEGKEVAKASVAKDPSSNDTAKQHCFCGVVSLLECVSGGGGAQPDRTSKRALRSKIREFNTRAQTAWGRSTRGTSSGALKRRDKLGSAGTPRRCHQPRHLPLPLNPSTRVSFAYELTSIAILVDASPSLTSTFGMESTMCEFGEEKSNTPQMNDECCVPLDRLGPLIKTYLQGLVQPIEVPPVAVSGLGVAFGRWTPNLAITVVAAYPPTSKGDRASAGLLVRDFRVTDESSALELSSQIERWALREVESVIAERWCGERDFSGDGVAGRDYGDHQSVPTLSPLGSFSFPYTQQMGPWTRVKSSMKDILAIGDAALSTLPPEGRPILLVATDCHNVHCGGVFESLSETARHDVPVSLLDLSSKPEQMGDHGPSQSSSVEKESTDTDFSPFLLSISDNSQYLQDACHRSGGIFLHHSTLLDSYVGTTVGSAMTPTSPLQGDYHFSFKKRSIKPNALQWYTLFTLSPFTPGGSPSSLRSMGTLGPSSFYRRNSVLSLSGSSGNSTRQILGKSSELPDPAAPSSLYDSRAKGDGERIVFSKYSIQPVRIKSLLMTRVLEGYHARRYGHNTQDKDKVSVHFVLRLADCGVTLHYEASFVSSPYHMPMVGQAHIKLELSGDDIEFIQTVKRTFVNHGADIQGRRVPASLKAAAGKICKLLRWTRKEDNLERFLCLPGWGTINHFAAGSSFLGRLELLSNLQRYRHFRSENVEIVTIGANFYEKSESLFSDLEQNVGEDEMYQVLSSWSTGVISDRSIYLKEIIPAKDDDLAYYCIMRVVQSPSLSQLFTISVDFHGELNAEQRLAVLSSLKDNLRGCTDIIVLEKCISTNVAIRPMSPTLQWTPSWNEYFLHHKCWELLQEKKVLPLITKRRNEIGNFFILHSDEHRAVFAKFVKNKDVVIYQVLSRDDGIFVDIHMEATQSTFCPFHARHSSTTFASIYEKVKRRDKDCAKNVRSRSNLLAALDHGRGNPDSAQFDPTGAKQAEDALRIIKLSTTKKKKLRFFNKEGSGSANDLLCRFTTECITSDSFQTQAAKLAIDQNKAIDDYSGSWFIMRVDWYVLSVVCLELRDQVQCEEGKMQSFRHLSFFTAGIIDLYQSDDDVNDAKNYVYTGVSEIATEIESSHAKNFARASYLALRDAHNPITSLEMNEVEYILSSCRFKEVLHAFVSVDDLSDHLSSDAQTMTGSKLGSVIGTLLQIVPGSNDEIFFYYGAEIEDSDEEAIKIGPNNIHDLSLNDSHDDFMAADVRSFPIEEDASDGMQSFDEVDDSIPHRHPDSDNPPLFFRFTLGQDQEVASLNDILALKKSATLTARVSVFEETEKKLPPSHAIVVSKLQSALNSFASEQTLEKYRFLGRCMTEEDFKVAMQNIAKTNHHRAEISLDFFISRSNSLVAANNPSGSEKDLDHGFTVLLDQLDLSPSTIRASHESFLVLDDSASRDVLPYWCFIQIRKPRGCIIVRVYHPLGDKAAEEQVQSTQKLVKAICHRTNQLLLLDSLYKTKNASNLLICDQEEPTEDHEQETLASTYSCPVQHTTTIPLHRRYAPNQAILALETTILQNFIITNRRGLFVYKDEKDNVFYLKLNSFKVSGADETEQNPHIIELLVFGCDNPGPSITDQLVCLLRRKLLTITLDALSSLLKKNPWFNLLTSDLAFIKNFSSALRELDHDNGPASPDRTRTYVLPPHVQDPLMLLLMFRQNICGSTFIQFLHHESSTDEGDTAEVEECADQLETLDWKPGMPEFHFYFNSSPSQLDPTYQPVTTLTERGRQYSRQAGSGIAIIEVNLQHGNNSECQIHVGRNENIINNKKLRLSKSDIGLQTDSPSEHNEHFKIRVDIINTTVDINVIHKWVELSLSQVLAAWSIERHLDSSRLGLLCSKPHKFSQYEGKTSEVSKSISLNQALPGYQTVVDMMSIANDLPHPAIVCVQNKRMLRATVLANLTLELIEAMFGSIVHKKKTFEGIDVIRYTDKDGASIVNIAKEDSPKKCARVNLPEKGKAIKDKPTDSPEYIVVFGLNGQSQKYLIDASQNLFFKEVSVQISTQQETTAFSRALSRIKNAKPSLFQRRLVFILSVSRSTRTLMTYNANPQIRSRMELRFKEIDQEATKADERCRDALQSRCLSHISFLPKDSFKPQISTKEALTDSAPKKSQEKKPEETIVKRGPARRIPRPTSMLRPKLIGKSVGGAAQQALTASRLRASSRQSLPQRTMPGAVKKKAAAAPQRERSKDKTPSTERRTSGSQQKKSRESSTKDAVSIVRSSPPQPTLLKTYRTFLSLLKGGSDLLSSRPRLNQCSLQHLAHLFLQSPKDKGTTLISTRLISTCYGNFLGTGSVEILQCDSEISSAKSFVDHLKKRWGAKKIVPMDHSCNSNYLCLKKELLTSSYRRAVILMEVSMTWSGARNSYIVHYKAWLMSSTDKAISEKLSRKTFASSGSIEREAAVIEAIALDFFGQLNLEYELFEFSCIRVARTARGRGSGPAILPLLKSVIARYDMESQSQLPFPGYSLQRRFLSPSSFLEGALLDSCIKETLVEHLRSNCQMYNLICCGSGDDTCLAGNMNVAGFLVYFIIAWHESVESALDVFVLCVTKGQRIDTYITKEGSPYAERISDVVLHSTMTTVQDVIETAAKNIRKLHLWHIFGEGYTSSSLTLGTTLIDSITELRSFSYHLDLVLVDFRLKTLLHDELDELKLSWRDVLQSITRSPSFPHSISFDEGEASNALVYYEEGGVFLDFILDQHGRVHKAQILAKEQFAYDDISNTMENIAVRCAVQKFTMFLLQWMWMDCCEPS